MSKQGSLVLFIVLLAFIVLSPIAVARTPNTAAELEAFLDSVIERQMTEAGIVGATVSVVSGGDVIISKGYGYADLSDRIRVDPEKTLFRVGSIAKLFVWTAVMQLVEQGKLDLHADVNEYLDFEIPGVLRGAARKSKPSPITLAHLMTHTAGFEDVGTDLFHLDAAHTIPLDEYIRTHVPARVFPPGEFAAYSNYGSALAGYIVQRVSGMPFSQYVEEHIFAPLGMVNSTFRQPVQPTLSSNVARGYRWNGEEFVEGDFVYALEPAGGLSTTAADMARFMLAHLQGGIVEDERVLSEDTVRLMQSRLHTQHPLLDGMAYGFVELTVNGQRALMHPGSNLLFNSGVYLLTQAGTGLFVSYSGGSFYEPTDLFREFMNHYYPAAAVTAASVTVPTTLADATPVRNISGEYHINRRNFSTDEAILALLDTLQVTMNDNGNLYVSHLGQRDEFVEVEPGIYVNVAPEESRNPYGMFRTLVFKAGPDGRTVLLSDGPMSYTKAPFYATSRFTISALLFSVITLAGTLVFWLMRSAINWTKQRTSSMPATAVVARWSAIVFGLSAVTFLFGTLTVSGDIDPAYGVPKAYFGIEPGWASMLNIFPIMMLVLGVAMVIFTVLAWRNRHWRFGERIHYSLVTVSSLVLLSIFGIWNVI